MDKKQTISPGALFAAAGAGFALYSSYDWHGMGRLINTGDPDHRLADYALFLVPLLLGCGTALRYRGAGGRGTRAGVGLACVGFALLAAAYFFAKWIYHAEIPIFVLLFYPGTLIVSAALLLLAAADRSKAVRTALAAAALLALAHAVAPQFAAASYGKPIGSEVKCWTGIALGASWMLLGLATLRRRAAPSAPSSGRTLGGRG
ncbi:hypothetical protein [Paenibacillus sp.]|uniref:hypothetical protein n=1 Tax=Paenibacillus sp. TaxID=58172 RepID=UPI002D5E76D8|nr:hypothetical protein [Paenibacillus sp.]HZG84237.1 hypothetical protein [Paenibacillus sp.]